jgi:alkylhydroperoxidase/carboxymuconolactone decarboxylase family protein YurZ
MDIALRKENWQYFKDQHPEAYQAYEALGKAIHERGPLTERECYLIKVAVAAASQYEYALTSLVERALEAGCGRDEIEHAILLTATTAGFPRMMTALLTYRNMPC